MPERVLKAVRKSETYSLRVLAMTFCDDENVLYLHDPVWWPVARAATEAVEIRLVQLNKLIFTAI